MCATASDTGEAVVLQAHLQTPLPDLRTQRAGLPEALREFLIETAVLDRFNAELADEVRARSDSAAMLMQLTPYEALVVPLGLDTFEGDPISGFQLRSADYLQVGASLATLGLPTVFSFEGGYAVAEVGVNAVNVLEGFESA